MIKLIIGVAAIVIIVLAILGLVDVQSLLSDAIAAIRDVLKTLLEGP